MVGQNELKDLLEYGTAGISNVNLLEFTGGRLSRQRAGRPTRYVGEGFQTDDPIAAATPNSLHDHTKPNGAVVTKSSLDSSGTDSTHSQPSLNFQGQVPSPPESDPMSPLTEPDEDLEVVDDASTSSDTNYYQAIRRRRASGGDLQHESKKRAKTTLSQGLNHSPESKKSLSRTKRAPTSKKLKKNNASAKGHKKALSSHTLALTPGSAEGAADSLEKSIHLDDNGQSQQDTEGNRNTTEGAIAIRETSPELSTRIAGTPVDAVIDVLHLSLANQIYNTFTTPLEDKPNALGEPQIWSNDRQGMTETLPYWRAQQGSVHQHEGVIRGLMFDAQAHHRDIISSIVCVVRGAGGKEKTEDGTMATGKDQTAVKQIGCVESNIRLQQPVVVVIGRKCPALQFKVEPAYSVLDTFQFTDQWYEKERGFAIARFRLQNTRPERRHWFIAPNTGSSGNLDLVSLLGTLPPPSERRCDKCNRISYQVFIHGWMCVADFGCPSFFKFANGNEPQDSELRYDPRFILRKQEFTNKSPPFGLIPNTFNADQKYLVGGNTSKAASMGFRCPHCGMCQIRQYWSDWKCRNEACGATGQFPAEIISSTALKQWNFPRNGGYAQSRDKIEKIGLGIIEEKVHFEKGYRFNIYKLPGNKYVQTGFLVHMIANDEVNAQPNGPDEHFEALQQPEVTRFLRRAEKRDARVGGHVHSAYYSHNFGEYYKFGVPTDSTDFSEAPAVIRKGRTRLNWGERIVHRVIREHFGHNAVADAEDKNELLLLGYMEEDKIDWHDDGEPGLGGTVGTYSLGGDANMCLRYHYRAYSGVTPKGLYVDKPPIPGCPNYPARLEKYEEYHLMIVGKSTKYPSTMPDDWTAEDGTYDSASLQELKKAIGKALDLKPKPNPPTLIKLKLRHGDMVFMVGKTLQEYYEHTVVHDGGWAPRFPMTARTIYPENQGNRARQGQRVGPDPDWYDGPNVPDYNDPAWYTRFG